MQYIFPTNLLTSALDLWDDLSRTSSQERSESSEKLKFLRDFKSGTQNETKLVRFPKGKMIFKPKQTSGNFF